MHRFILILPLAILPACDVDEPLHDDDLQVQIVDEHVEEDRVIRTVENFEPASDELIIRTVEIFEPIADELASIPEEPTFACTCSGCRQQGRPDLLGPCQSPGELPNHDCCVHCWEGLPPCECT